MSTQGAKTFSTETNSNRTDRPKWKYADHAFEFQARHGNERFSITFNPLLERAMRDPKLDSETRLLLAAIRFSWGHLSNTMVNCMPKLGPADPEPKCLNQQELARLLEMPTSTLSETLDSLRKQNYLERRREGITLLDQRGVSAKQTGASETAGFATPTPVTSDIPNKSRFASFEEGWRSLYPGLANQQDEIRKQKARLREELAGLRRADKQIEMQKMAWTKKEMRRAAKSQADQAPNSDEFADTEPVLSAPSAEEVRVDSSAEQFATPPDDPRTPRSEVRSDRTHPQESPCEISNNLETPLNPPNRDASSMLDSGLAGEEGNEPNGQPLSQHFQQILSELAERKFWFTPQNVEELRRRLGDTPAEPFLALIDEAVQKKKRKGELVGRGLVMSIAAEAACASAATLARKKPIEAAGAACDDVKKLRERREEQRRRHGYAG